MIPNEKIEELREKASIVQVVSEYVSLKKKGGNWFGLCPFHSEKTPSFSVNEEKRIFYCFGCHETGSVITFLMKKEGVTFPEAARALARRFGVDIKDEGRSSGEREALFRVNRVAADFFTAMLRSPQGRRARMYLASRGYGSDHEGLLKDFEIGYAPGGWEALTGHLGKKGLSLELAERAGLVARKGRRFYDRFRGRLIFPIHDTRGRIAGFGGRALDDSPPKYLNTPETALFKKGRVLYGLARARPKMGESGSAIVVEGYFDLLAMHRAGFTNTVATLGTALTAEHVRALAGHAEKVYTLFDADDAGLKATVRALELFLDEDVECMVVRTSGGKDPDDFLSSSGPEAMAAALSRAVPLMEFFLLETAKRYDLATATGKAAFLEEALRHLRRIKSPAKREHYAAALASVAGLSPSTVFEALKAVGPGSSGRRAVEGIASLRASALAESTILRVILRHPALFCEDVKRAAALFREPALREAARVIVSHLCDRGTFDPAALSDDLREAGCPGLAAELLGGEDGFIEEPERMLKDSLKKVFNRGKLKKSTMELIRRLDESGRKDLAETIMNRINKDS